MEQAEQQIAAALDTADVARATTLTLRAYGPEVLGFLVASLRDDALAEDAFAAFAEKLWTTLAKFERRCSMRTWVYLIARHAARDARRMKRRSKNEVELRSSAIGALAMQIRDDTMQHLKSTSRSAIERLRDELSEEDRMLLVLRVDRRLAWNDLARVFLEQDNVIDPDDETLARESARLRKRFQLVKEKLHELGRTRGIVPKV